MDENDWAHTLAVFRACLPRRGRKAEEDRRFLEALHFFTAVASISTTHSGRASAVTTMPVETGWTPFSQRPMTW